MMWMPETPIVNQKATNKSLYLQPEDLNLLDRIASVKNVGLSEAAHHVFREYDSWEDRQVKKDFVFYLVYPLVFMVFSTAVSVLTEHLVGILMEKGFYFNELYLFNRVFNVISFGSISIFIACVYLLRKKWVEAKDGN